MSLQHVMRAEKLGSASGRDEKRLQRVLDGPDLGEIRSEAGCNMLQVYLLRRWGRMFGDAPALRKTEAFQNDVVDAYIEAGCSVDEAVPSRDFGTYGGPHVSYGDIAFSGELSALGIVQVLRDQFPEDFDRELHAQLGRLERRLSAHAAGDSPRPVAVGIDEARAVVIRGVRLRLAANAPEISDYREVAEALGMEVVVCADEANVRADDEVDVLFGIAVASASSDEDGPVPISNWPELGANQQRYLASLSEPGIHLGAYGPLASAYVVRGEIADEGPQGAFFVGASTSQTAHERGVAGELVASAHLGARSFEAPKDETLFLIARYD